MNPTNPTTAIDLDFDRYLERRKQELASHLTNGAPDYAFTLDMQLRQQLSAMGPVRYIAQVVVHNIVPLQKQVQQMESVAVGPRQYPEIHAMAETCAHKLGIGIPQVFVRYSPILNAYTIATDDQAPMIVVHSALVEAMEPAELLFVIGHECGHIHNLHGVYNTAMELLLNPATAVLLASVPGLGVLRGALQLGVQLFFASWSRCAEVSCDRAGLICAGDLTASQMALAKLATGGGDKLGGLNIQQYLQQIKQVQSTPVRLLELTKSHPLIPKRLEALKLFTDCDVLHAWRPEMRTTATSRTRSEIDAQCEQFIRVLAQGYQPKAQ